MMSHTATSILIVDDETANLQLLRQILQDDYQVAFARTGQEALDHARQHHPNLILMDVMMPGMTGYEACRRLKADPQTAAIPVVFVTALNGTHDEVAAFSAGGVDFINKPVSPLTVKARVRTHLSLVHVEELKATRLQIVQRLARAAEYRDNDTGQHVVRMSLYAYTLAIGYGLSEAVADDLLNASPMHDIGKIGIPDHILGKPGPLNAEEWVTMRKHPMIGAEIIGEHTNSMLRMAREIALCHHEKWDGSGYPGGLMGEEIPISARIVAVADVFDALT
ncbi:MAG: response regulator, partial [Alcaligenaceae bacterium]